MPFTCSFDLDTGLNPQHVTVGDLGLLRTETREETRGFGGPTKGHFVFIGPQSPQAKVQGISDIVLDRHERLRGVQSMGDAGGVCVLLVGHGRYERPPRDHDRLGIFEGLSCH